MLNSVILPVHSEGHILLKTLASLAEAVSFAAGHEFELVIVCDNADERTKSVVDYYDYSAFKSVNILDVAFGSAGLTRNTGVRAARGDFIFFADGDDLVSYNYFTEIIAARDAEKDEKKIYFPELYCEFGAKDCVIKYYDMAVASPLMMFSWHLFASTVSAYKTALLDVPQTDIRIAEGYAYEDYSHNLELLAHGYEFHIVPNIIMFYRKREGVGVLHETDKISVKLPFPSSYFSPHIYVKLCRSDYNKYRFAKHTKFPNPEIAKERALELSGLFERAHALEPLINEKGKIKDCWSPLDAAAAGLNTALTYFEICDTIKNMAFDHIFLIPFLTKGGAEKYALNIIRDLNAQFPLSRILIIGGEKYEGQAALDQLSPNAIFLDLGAMGQGDIADNCLLTLRMIEAVSKPSAKIHLIPCPYVKRFLEKYNPVLHDRNFVFYYFCRDFRPREDKKICSDNFRFILDNAELCSLLISDNRHEFHQAVEDGPLPVQRALENKFSPLYTFCPIVRDAAACETSPEAGLFWASRIDTQKRVSLLPLIGRQLAGLKKKLRVYGYSAFNPSHIKSLENMRGIDYKGGFDGISSLPAKAFDIFVYTSYIDGMPNAVLEAIAAGLLVIAPDVGGISEIIKDGETGILLPSLEDDKAMAKSYIEAINRACGNPQMRRELVLKAQKLLREQHSEAHFARRVQELFSSSAEYGK